MKKRKSLIISSNPLLLGKKNVISVIPCGEITKKFVHVKTIWEDIQRLIDIINQQEDEYNKRLIAKQIIIELISFRDNCRSLMKEIAKDDTLKSVSRTIRRKFESTFRKHSIFEDIRNRMGGHRDHDVDIKELIKYWDNINQFNLNELLNASHECLMAIIDSDPLIFRPYLLEGVELKGISVENFSIARKKF